MNQNCARAHGRNRRIAVELTRPNHSAEEPDQPTELYQQQQHQQQCNQTPRKHAQNHQSHAKRNPEHNWTPRRRPRNKTLKTPNASAERGYAKLCPGGTGRIRICVDGQHAEIPEASGLLDSSGNPVRTRSAADSAVRLANTPCLALVAVRYPPRA